MSLDERRGVIVTLQFFLREEIFVFRLPRLGRRFST